jgi:acetyl-CoA carboxylase biotin carboxyl carrier protein
MDIRKVKKLIEMIDETGVSEIEIHEGEESVRVSRYPTNMPQMMAYPQQYMAPNPQAPAPAATTSPSGSTQKSKPAVEDLPDGHIVKSPMVGTVYLSATPGEKPFVDVGDRVKVGDVICLVEAMKMFNQIEVDKAGIISARLINNEQPVEYDQPLFIIDEE